LPELPEVETIVRDLSKSLHGKIFSKVIVHDAYVLRGNVEDFIRKIKGKAVGKISRRGKAVVVHLTSGEFLVIQLMMTGQLIVDGRADKHTRIEFILSGGTRLLYNDQRRFGQLRLVEDLGHVQHFNILGPEPFSKEFTPALMSETFRKTKRPIKNLLLDHTFVAGIGNIYACEILFRSRLNPTRPACRVTQAQIKTIHRHIIEVLNEAILYRGTSMRNYRDGSGEKGRFSERLAVYARQGLPCPRCQRPIDRLTQAGRSTFYCGHCQK